MSDPTPKTRWPLKVWIRLGFVLWALFVMSWLANSVRTRGVSEDVLRSSQQLSVLNDPISLSFLPDSLQGRTALIFICGSGIAAQAYAPLLRPIAEQGFPVFVVRLPYRFAPLESHKLEAIDRVHAIMAAHPEMKHWVIAGHSLGAALAARMAKVAPEALSALVLVASTHPKQDDLSFLKIPVTKIYASNDGVAPPARVLANRKLLPAHTKWLEISGGNHSQFGRYGHQLFDGTASIARDQQEALTRTALLSVLNGVEAPD